MRSGTIELHFKPKHKVVAQVVLPAGSDLHAALARSRENLKVLEKIYWGSN